MREKYLLEYQIVIENVYIISSLVAESLSGEGNAWEGTIIVKFI